MNLFHKIFEKGSRDPFVEEEIVKKHKLFFNALMPPGWFIAKTQNYVFPYGHSEEFYMDQPGFMISLAGPIPQEGEVQEAFTLWIMPAPYRTQPENPQKPGPTKIGTNQTHVVFAWQHSAETKTWPTWREEVRKALKLMTDAPFITVKY